MCTLPSLNVYNPESTIYAISKENGNKIIAKSKK